MGPCQAQIHQDYEDAVYAYARIKGAVLQRVFEGAAFLFTSGHELLRRVGAILHSRLFESQDPRKKIVALFGVIRLGIILKLRVDHLRIILKKTI